MNIMDLNEKKEVLQIIKSHWVYNMDQNGCEPNQRRINREVMWQTICEEARQLGHQWAEDPDHNGRWLCRKFASWKDDYKQKRKRHLRTSGAFVRERLSEMDLIIMELLGDSLDDEDTPAAVMAPTVDADGTTSGTTNTVIVTDGMVTRKRVPIKKEGSITSSAPQKKRKTVGGGTISSSSNNRNSFSGGGLIDNKMLFQTPRAQSRKLEELEIRRKEQELRLGELQIQKEEMSIWQMHLQIYKMENELGIAHRYIDINGVQVGGGGVADGSPTGDTSSHVLNI